jgi:hypothetical protein
MQQMKTLTTLRQLPQQLLMRQQLLHWWQLKQLRWPHWQRHPRLRT